MSNRITLIAILVLVLLTTNIQAQNTVSSVTGSVTPEGIVRMIAHGETLQIRMEVYSAAGELISDSGFRQGNLVDWKQSDASLPMIDGSYLVVIIVKNFKGNLTKRSAALSLQAGQLGLQKRDEKTKVTEGDDAISILREGKERSVIVTAHDGTDGQVSSTSGALTFRTGNVFSSQEQEQMRVTADGRVGIGTKNPEATLDVAGTIKARGGIQFDDSTVLSSAKDQKDGAAAAGGNLSGTNIITAINDPTTTGVISDSRVSLNLARLAGANTWSNFNTFSAGLSANNAQITNVGNPQNGGDAVNKNYLDANAVRFMPATKENFALVNGGDVLSRLRGIDVSTWNYITEGGKVRHMGPMAEDFYNAFQLGTNNTSIGVQDLTGVSLAASKELDKRTTEVEQLREEVNQLRHVNSDLERRLATLEQLMRQH